jgi:hypothetical protein
LSTPNLFDDEDESFPPEPESAAPPERSKSVPEPPPEPESPPVRERYLPALRETETPVSFHLPALRLLPGDPSEPEKPRSIAKPLRPQPNVPENTTRTPSGKSL